MVTKTADAQCFAMEQVRTTRNLINGIMERANLSAFGVSLPDENVSLGDILKLFSHNHINLDFVSNVTHSGDERASCIVCVSCNDVDSAYSLLKQLQNERPGVSIKEMGRVSILSIYPHREKPSVLALLMQAFSGNHVPLFAIGNSLSSISCVMPQECSPEAIKALSSVFGLL